MLFLGAFWLRIASVPGELLPPAVGQWNCVSRSVYRVFHMLERNFPPKKSNIVGGFNEWQIFRWQSPWTWLNGWLNKTYDFDMRNHRFFHIFYHCQCWVLLTMTTVFPKPSTSSHFIPSHDLSLKLTTSSVCPHLMQTLTTAVQDSRQRKRFYFCNSDLWRFQKAPTKWCHPASSYIRSEKCHSGESLRTLGTCSKKHRSTVILVVKKWVRKSQIHSESTTNKKG